MVLCKFYTFRFLFSNIHLFVFFKQILYILTKKYLSFQKIGCWLTQKFPSKNCRHPHFFHYLCACYSCGCPTANGGRCYSPLPIGHPRDFPNEEIQLNNIKFSTCEKIKTYLEHYKDKKPKRIPRPLPNKDFKEVVGEWDYEYINIDVESIYELMQASNFLGIDSLLDLTSAKIASLIKGKNPEEIRRILGMDDQDIDELEENEIIDEDDDE